MDLNANADPLDDVAGQAAAFKTMFDRFGLYANGALKRGFSVVNLQSYDEAAAGASVNNDPLTGAALPGPLPAVAINTTFPDAASARLRRLEAYGDGVTISREQLALEFGGGVSPRASFGSPDRNVEERVSFGAAVIRIVMPSNAASVTGVTPTWP